ncbi:MAG TPA: carboxypeptidase-like regulatory domain-containing protein, partial [Chitinophagaceae bacterium]|nr:carboxypeptidase-like regulatory domain-containing protein [Chitinophagaceae bacterium]
MEKNNFTAPGFSFLKLRLFFLLFGLIGSTCYLHAQPNTKVNGVIKDAKGTPLANASVTVKGTTAGTTTDANGNYSINVAGPKAVLVFSSIG